ncbi:MAG: hypothetical protein HQL99_02195 [Magnetococcales bacterium]|nr:hypothetical protein [Magnetococcales bacterium]
MPRILFSRKPGVCRPSTVLSLALVLGVPVSAEAFSLGELRIFSALGEPFRAEIPLLLAPGEEQADLAMTLAAPEEYRLMELVRSPAVAGLTATLSPGMDRQRRVTIRSTAPVTDPFFQLLIKGSVGRGSQVRAYRVMLDPSPRERAALRPDAAIRQSSTTPTAAKAPARQDQKPRQKSKPVPAKSVTPVTINGVAASTLAVAPSAAPSVGTPAAGMAVGTPAATPVGMLPASASPVTGQPGAGAIPTLPKITAASSPLAGPAAASQPSAESETALATRLTDTLQQLKTLTERYEEANQKRVQSEAEREKLRSRLTAMTKRVEALENEKLAALQEAIDWPLVGGVGATGVLVLVGGGLVWWRRRARVREESLDPASDHTSGAASLASDHKSGSESSAVGKVDVEAGSEERAFVSGFVPQTAPQVPVIPAAVTSAGSAVSAVVPAAASMAVVGTLPLLALASGAGKEDEEMEDGELETVGLTSLEGALASGVGKQDQEREGEELEPVGLISLEGGASQDARNAQDALMLFSPFPDLDEGADPEEDGGGVEWVVEETDAMRMEEASAPDLPEIIPFSMDQTVSGGTVARGAERAGERIAEDDPMDVIEFDRDRIFAPVAAEMVSGAGKTDKREWPTAAQEDDDDMVLEISDDFSGSDNFRR